MHNEKIECEAVQMGWDSLLSLKILRWTMGYVKFSVKKGSPERFMNQCARSRISIWNFYSGKKYGACIYAGSYRSLLNCAHKAGVVLRVEERNGLPFLLKPIRRRRGLVYGAGLFLVILALLSMHYWSINVSGNLSIPTEQVEARLVEYGVVPGVWKRKVDSQMLQQKLMRAFPEIRWLSVNTNGCTLTVQLEESVKKPEVENGKKISNVKASAAGQIIYMEVYDGTPEVAKGDAVVEGQLLINAVVEDAFGGTSLKHASGKVIAETNRTFTTQVNLTKKEAVPTGRTILRRSGTIFGLRLPLTVSMEPEGKNWQLDATLNKVQLCGVLLPVSLYTEHWTEQHEQEIPISQEQALKEAKEKMSLLQKQQMKEGKIIESKESVKKVGNTLLYTVEAKCEENIAVENELIVKP